ncbi:dimethyl sulfoxide reductase anchor subunit [Gammaproteobacteria bacterium]|nr:dimethyl sulfoxide reductase anchor subunit [Gammaproteobacteria bacterium]
MHPAYSVIFFTVSSGAGYGLLALLGILNIGNYLPDDKWFFFITLALSLTLITLGLLSSTLHLGHPERAWRALTQWKTSWLSREGVAAVLTYIPAGVLALGWLFSEQTNDIYVAVGLLAAIGSGITVYCTSMIYASLKAIPAWTFSLVPVLYLFLSITSGNLLLITLLSAFDSEVAGLSMFCILILLITMFLKIKYWNMVDRMPTNSNIETATGLGKIGKPTVLEKPHTSENYLQREMGFQIARKHSEKLRRISLITLFILPVILINLTFLTPTIAFTLTLTAVIFAAIGLSIERWLFFAEAKHVVMNYYED